MEETLKIKWVPPTLSLSQTASYSGLEYALASAKNEQVHQFATCKDFLQDAIYGHVNKKSIEIYRFKYNPATFPPVNMRKTTMLIANTGIINEKFNPTLANITERIPGMLDFLNQIEKELKFKKKTTAKLCDSPPKKYATSGVWLLESTARWMKSPVLVSLYTLLIRVGLGHIAGQPYTETIDKIIKGEIEPYESKDTDQLGDAIKGLNVILKYGEKNIFTGTIKQNYPTKVCVGDIHDHCGIVSFTSKYAKNYLPHCYAKLDVKEL